MVKAVVDKKKCIGCGACESACPEAFKMMEDSKAKFVGDGKEKCIKEGVDICPVQAITLK